MGKDGEMSKYMDNKKTHYDVPRWNNNILRLTWCCVENKTTAYKSTTHMDKVTCQKCIAEINKHLRRAKA